MGFLSKFMSGAGQGLSEVGGNMQQNALRDESNLKLEEVRAQRERETEERKAAIRQTERKEDFEQQNARDDKRFGRDVQLESMREKRQGAGSLHTNPANGELGRVGPDNTFIPIKTLEGEVVGGNKDMTASDKERIKFKRERIKSLDKDKIDADEKKILSIEAQQLKLEAEIEDVSNKKKKEVEMPRQNSLFDERNPLGGPATGGLTTERPASNKPTQGANSKQAPQEALNMLAKDPSLAPFFKQKYGYLPEGL